MPAFVITGSGQVDLRAVDLSTYDGLRFATSGATTALLNSDQLGDFVNSIDVLVTGNRLFADTLEIQLPPDSLGSASFDGRYLKFTGWNASADRIVIKENSTNTGSEFITGSSQADFIYAGKGMDTVNGAAGNDTIILSEVAGYSFSSINGGDGVDTITLNYAGLLSEILIRADLVSGYANNGQRLRADLENIERIIATTGAANDILGTTPSIIGTFDGGAGIDTLALDYSTATAALKVDLNAAGIQTFGAGNTFQNMEALAATGGAGKDILTSRTGAPRDQIQDKLNGGGGDDVLTLGSWYDRADGGLGNDTLIINLSAETGNIESSAAGLNGNYILSGVGDIQYLGIEKIVVTAGSGNDFLATARQIAVLDGGAGIDTWRADFTGSPTALKADLNISGAQNVGGGNSIANIEAFFITGGSGDDTFISRLGVPDDGIDDRIFGGAGKDTIVVGGGQDVVVGSVGDGVDTDTLVINYANETLAITGGTSYQGVTALAQGTFTDKSNTSVSFSSIETINVTTGLGNDDIKTGDGADILKTGAGNDKMFAGLGSDNLYGGIGADLHNGGGGFDYARYDDANYGAIRASLTAPANNTGAAAGDTYIDIEGLAGGAGNDVLTGNSASNALYGQGGDDVLLGGLGADRLVGGDGIDYARYDDANYGNLVITLLAPQYNTGAAAGDTYNGIEGLMGGAGNDRIDGNIYVNYLYGLGGNDMIVANAGNDTVSGGAGLDIFVFNSALDALTNVDRILDFSAADDTIWIDRTYFTGLDVGGLASSQFASGPAAADADDRVIYHQGTGALFFDADGNGSAFAQVQFATLVTKPTITNADFVVIA